MPPGDGVCAPRGWRLCPPGMVFVSPKWAAPPAPLCPELWGWWDASVPFPSFRVCSIPRAPVLMGSSWRWHVCAAADLGFPPRPPALCNRQSSVPKTGMGALLLLGLEEAEMEARRYRELQPGEQRSHSSSKHGTGGVGLLAHWVGAGFAPGWCGPGASERPPCAVSRCQRGFSGPKTAPVPRGTRRILVSSSPSQQQPLERDRGERAGCWGQAHGDGSPVQPWRSHPRVPALGSRVSAGPAGFPCHAATSRSCLRCVKGANVFHASGFWGVFSFFFFLIA